MRWMSFEMKSMRMQESTKSGPRRGMISELGKNLKQDKKCCSTIQSFAIFWKVEIKMF